MIFTAMRFLSISGRIAFDARSEVLCGHILTIWFRFRQVRWFRFGRSCHASTIIRGKSRLLCAGREIGWPHIRASNAFICSIVGHVERSIGSLWHTILRCFGHDNEAKVCRKEGRLHTFMPEPAYFFKNYAGLDLHTFGVNYAGFAQKYAEKPAYFFEGQCALRPWNHWVFGVPAYFRAFSLSPYKFEKKKRGNNTGRCWRRKRATKVCSGLIPAYF